MRYIPDLAEHIASDILSDDGRRDGTISRSLQPSNTSGKERHRMAFRAVWLEDDTLSDDAPLYPYANPDEERLIEEFGLTGIKVLPHVREILRISGAYPSVEEYARSALLRAPVSNDTCSTGMGWDCLRQAILELFPNLIEDNIVMHHFDYSIPSIALDETKHAVAVKEPAACDLHEKRQCTCWIWRCLSDLAQEYSNSHPEFGAGLPLSMVVLRVYLKHVKTSYWDTDSEDLADAEQSSLDGSDDGSDDNSAADDNDSFASTPEYNLTEPAMDLGQLSQRDPSQLSTKDLSGQKGQLVEYCQKLEKKNKLVKGKDLCIRVLEQRTTSLMGEVKRLEKHLKQKDRVVLGVKRLLEQSGQLEEDAPDGPKQVDDVGETSKSKRFRTDNM
ncbi:hypothetical protein CERSUDRAFT_97083 [Gelatoporia subvermispora B]|uniref:Uncharacterized protein n=1 Tax=Ceriporiopsis subvermispora (strain B) TaxID=914234 RepID=M2R9N3_CERS8|nr:hypothetical protein CERSUDRAFT_97083 [Gelatoporia subvermispora B]